MSKPPLRLHIEQGPKAGHVLDCQPSTITWLGRSRGNTLQIARDPGISQKHLYFCFCEQDQRWTVTDNDSSNGTLLNGVPLEPTQAMPLSSRDLIKIGEETTIRAEITTIFEQKNRPNATKTRTSIPSANIGLEHGKFGAKYGKIGPEYAILIEDDDSIGPKKRGRGGPHGRARLSASSAKKEIRETQDDAEKSSQRVQRNPRKCSITEAFLADAEKTEVPSLDSMTVAQWFEHMMEDGPKFLYQASEAIIQEINIEAKMFDDYIRSLTQA